MADDTDDELETPKKGGKLKLIIMLVLALLVLGGGGYTAAAYFLQLPPFDVDEVSLAEIRAAERAAAEAIERERTRDMYVKFDSAFTFNPPSKNRLHTGQIDVVLVVAGPDNHELATKNLPLLSSTIFSVLSNQSYESLLKPSGRLRLKRIIMDATRAKMSEVAKNPLVEQVLFTSFVLQ